MSNYSSVCYKNNFLTNAIFRINFAPILLLTTENPTAFQEQIREHFPKLEEPKAMSFAINFNAGDAKMQREEVKNYKFSSKDGTASIAINRDSFAVSLKKYSSFEEFKDIISLTFNAFENIYKPLNISRAGLRYVNNIKISEGSAVDWTGYIQESLIKGIRDLPFGNDKLSRYMTQCTLKYEDFFVVFNYGIFNSEFPQPVSRKEFILDIDTFTNSIESNNVLEYLNKFHESIQNVYEKSIDVKLRDLMELQ